MEKSLDNLQQRTSCKGRTEASALDVILRFILRLFYATRLKQSQNKCYQYHWNPSCIMNYVEKKYLSLTSVSLTLHDHTMPFQGKLPETESVDRNLCIYNLVLSVKVYYLPIDVSLTLRTSAVPSNTDKKSVVDLVTLPG